LQLALALVLTLGAVNAADHRRVMAVIRYLSW
jgi:hypothetical protein